MVGLFSLRETFYQRGTLAEGKPPLPFFHLCHCLFLQTLHDYDNWYIRYSRSSLCTPGADPGLGFEFVSAEGVTSLGGGGGGGVLESFKIWNVGDAISRAFRVNLRQKRGLDRTH